jgi:hypothetical protein
MTHTQNFESGNVNSLKSFRQAVSLAGRFCSGFSELKSLARVAFGNWILVCVALGPGGHPAEPCLELMPDILYTRRGKGLDRPLSADR